LNIEQGILNVEVGNVVGQATNNGMKIPLCAGNFEWGMRHCSINSFGMEPGAL
jgi:hypothetical protein